MSFEHAGRTSFSAILSVCARFFCQRTFKGDVDNRLLGLGVSKMQERWVGKNVDLSLLSERVENFFADKGFITTKDWSASEYAISAKPQRGVAIIGRVNVRILGDPNDFLIEFSTSEHSRSAVKLGFFTTMFGGGSLLLRGLKSREALEKLEKDFWLHTEEAIGYLSNSKD
jgi:hypothetical protein